MAAPSAGRVRVILGDTGNSWLLLLEGVSGGSVWYKQDWNDIPAAVSKQLNNCAMKGRHATEVAFGPSGAWYIHGIKADGTGAYSWSGNLSQSININNYDKYAFGINTENDQESFFLVKGDNKFYCHNCPSGLVERAHQIRQRGKRIHFVRLFPDNGYFICDDDGYHSESVEFGKDIDAIEDIAFAGDGSWVVIHSDHFKASSGISEDLTRSLEEYFATNQRPSGMSKQAVEEDDQLENDTDPNGGQIQQQSRELCELIGKLQERADKASELETELGHLRDLTESRLIEETQHIKALEQVVSARKRSIAETIEKMPPCHRSRLRRRLLPNESDGACVICRGSKATIAIVPCGHLCMCQDCATELATREETCPLCRGQVTGTLKIYGACILQGVDS